MRPGAKLSVLLLTFAIILPTSCLLHVQANPADAPMSRAPGLNIDWNGTVNLTSNVTVEAGQKLSIAPGTRVVFGLDVSILVLGELECGNAGGAVVEFANEQDRLSGGFVLQNCNRASFANTRFEDLGLAVEAIYSTVSLTSCAINNTGIGILAFESLVRLEACNITNCDVGANLVRCNSTVTACGFEGNVQSLILNSDVGLIQTFFDRVISLVERIASPVDGREDLAASLDTSWFVQSGVGVAAISLTRLSVNYCAFEYCKKGVEARFSPGAIRFCWFDQNAQDFEVVGRQTRVQDNITQPLNYTYYHEFSMTAFGPGGSPLSASKLTVSHPGMYNQTYYTDANGSADHIILLRQKAKGGNVTTYSDYRVTVSGLKGYHIMDDSPAVELEQETMVGWKKEKGDSVWVYALVIISVIILLALIIWLWQARRKGGREGAGGPGDLWRIR